MNQKSTIEKLNDYFESKKKDYEVKSKREFNPDSFVYRFVKDGAIKILKISEEVIEDLDFKEIKQKLERERWDRKIDQTTKPLILTHLGLKELMEKIKKK